MTFYFVSPQTHNPATFVANKCMYQLIIQLLGNVPYLMAIENGNPVLTRDLVAGVRPTNKADSV
jgi:hypothetical protein